MQRKNYTLRRKIKETSSLGVLTYGFGSMAFIMNFLPFINTLLKPLLVVAGTKLYLERVRTVYN